jgi:hypothetical protein
MKRPSTLILELYIKKIVTEEDYSRRVQCCDVK